MPLQNVKIGKTVLEKILTNPIKTNEKKIKEIDQLIENLGGPMGEIAFEAEKLQLHLLRKERAQCTYPKIDLSFLSMDDILEYNGFKIQVPKFSVYPIYEENEFSINFRRDSGNYFISISGDKLSDIFDQELLKSTELHKFSNFRGGFNYYGKRHYRFEDLPRNIKKKYKNKIYITSKLNILYPIKTKEKITKSNKIFKAEEIHTITETKPGDWNITKKITKDPLIIVGLIGKDCYLIDNFTPAKDYLKSELPKNLY